MGIREADREIEIDFLRTNKKLWFGLWLFTVTIFTVVLILFAYKHQKELGNVNALRQENERLYIEREVLIEAKSCK